MKEWGLTRSESSHCRMVTPQGWLGCLDPGSFLSSRDVAVPTERNLLTLFSKIAGRSKKQSAAKVAWWIIANNNLEVVNCSWLIVNRKGLHLWNKCGRSELLVQALFGKKAGVCSCSGQKNLRCGSAYQMARTKYLFSCQVAKESKLVLGWNAGLRLLLWFWGQMVTRTALGSE